ncbi:MAG: hypothetical protein ACRDY7_03895 [Acidimicrobiia bacterium]
MMAGPLAPPRGTIEWKIPSYQERTKFFNMYDSLDSLEAFDPVEMVGYAAHRVDLVKAQGEDAWRTAEVDDELLFVVQGGLRVRFREGERSVARATAVDGEVLLLPRALSYQISSDGDAPALYLHLRTRDGSAVTAS